MVSTLNLANVDVDGFFPAIDQRYIAMLIASFHPPIGSGLSFAT
jgi:hypothetical protein